VVPLYYLCSCGESRLLILWCVGDKCDMMGNDEDLDRSRRSGAEDWGWSNISQVLDDRTIRRSGDTVCRLHRVNGDEDYGFLG
jgi:hypothetical protein